MQQGLCLEAWEADLALPLGCRVTLGKSLSLSGPQFPQLSGEDAPAPKGPCRSGRGN